jgi:hypothetical protein
MGGVTMPNIRGKKQRATTIQFGSIKWCLLCRAHPYFTQKQTKNTKIKTSRTGYMRINQFKCTQLRACGSEQNQKLVFCPRPSSFEFAMPTKKTQLSQGPPWANLLEEGVLGRGASHRKSQHLVRQQRRPHHFGVEASAEDKHTKG